MTQQNLSDRTGIAIRTISKIERGKMNPSFEILSILVPVLGMSFDSIFSSDGNEIETDIHEIAVLYRSCSENGGKIFLTSARAVAREIMNIDL